MLSLNANRRRFKTLLREQKRLLFTIEIDQVKMKQQRSYIHKIDFSACISPDEINFINQITQKSQ